jgi:hypothetical protein
MAEQLYQLPLPAEMVQHVIQVGKLGLCPEHHCWEEATSNCTLCDTVVCKEHTRNRNSDFCRSGCCLYCNHCKSRQRCDDLMWMCEGPSLVCSKDTHSVPCCGTKDTSTCCKWVGCDLRTCVDCNERVCCKHSEWLGTVRNREQYELHGTYVCGLCWPDIRSRADNKLLL